MQQVKSQNGIRKMCKDSNCDTCLLKVSEEKEKNTTASNSVFHTDSTHTNLLTVECVCASHTVT